MVIGTNLGTKEMTDSQSLMHEDPQQHGSMEQLEPLENFENHADPETGSDSDMVASNPAQSEQERKMSRRGGRPRSLVWQHFIVSGERTDKSRRFNLCCKACGIDMVSRLGTMEKHIAYECEKTDLEAKIKIQGKLAIKSVQAIGNAAKRMKKEGRRRVSEVVPPIVTRPFLVLGEHSLTVSLLWKRL
jgi:hypothetical protein